MASNFSCYASLIFSHSFAKAFWGTEEQENKLILDMSAMAKDEAFETYKKLNQHKEKRGYCWQYHLQQMVLEEQPLQYLRRFL